MRLVQWAERGTAVTEQRSSLKMLIYRSFATLSDLSSDGPFKILSRRLADSSAKKKKRILPSFFNLFLFSAVHLLNYKQTVLKI